MTYLERQARTCNKAPCRARIVWARTPNGKPMPLDVEPDVMGNVAVHVDGTGRVNARVLPADGKPEPFEKLHLPHFATCAGLKPPGPRKDGVTPLYRKRAAKRQAATPPREDPLW